MANKNEFGNDEVCHQEAHGSYQENKKRILDGLSRVGRAGQGNSKDG